MNLNLIRSKNETQDLLLSITKKCETLIDQTHRKGEETLEFKMTKPKELSRFSPLIQINWMIGLTDLKVLNSHYNKTKENNKLELYTDIFDELTFMELKDELEETFNLKEIAAEHLQADILGPHSIKLYKKLKSEKSSTDAYLILLANYVKSTFRDFESYLRIVICLDEDDIHLVLNQFISIFVTYEIPPGVYTTKEIIYTIAERRTLRIESNDVTMKTNSILSPFVMLKFNEKSFLINY